MYGITRQRGQCDMKKRVLLITFIIAIIMSMFATTAVFATGDDHGEDAHSDSMAVLEEDDYGDEDLSFKAMLVNTVMDHIVYVVGAVTALIILIVVIKVVGTINRRREPKYKGRH